MVDVGDGFYVPERAILNFGVRRRFVCWNREMHPDKREIYSDVPGRCPICGRFLCYEGKDAEKCIIPL